jgi:hypothetical protein
MPAVAGFTAGAGISAVAGFTAVAGISAIAGFTAVAGISTVDGVPIVVCMTIFHCPTILSTDGLVSILKK